MEALGSPPTLPRLDTPILPTTLRHSTDTTLPSIALVDAASYICTCKLEGSVQFSMLHIPKGIDLCSASASASDHPDLSCVLPEYHEFADVFNKAKADGLPPHQQYDLNIDFEEGSSLPLGVIYSLSPIKLEVLHKFLNENLANGIIHPSSSTHGAPIIFVCKKDGSLHLCVNF